VIACKLHILLFMLYWPLPSQDVSDGACKLKTPLLMHFCFPTGCKLLCLQTADPVAHTVSAFALPQVVSDCACKLQTPLLMLFLSSSSCSMYVIVLANCRYLCLCYI